MSKNDILEKIIKSYNDIVSYCIDHKLNNSMLSSIFPSDQKKADIIPIPKKKRKFDIENNLPVSRSFQYL